MEINLGLGVQARPPRCPGDPRICGRLFNLPAFTGRIGATLTHESRTEGFDLGECSDGLPGFLCPIVMALMSSGQLTQQAQATA